MRWSLALQPYKFVIMHRKGVDNANADALFQSLDKRRGRGVRDQAIFNRPTSSCTVLQLEKLDFNICNNDVIPVLVCSRRFL